MLSTRSGVLAAGHEGLFVFRDGRDRVLTDARTYALHRSRRDSSVVYATGLDGEVLRLQRRDDRWRIADRTDRFEASLPTVAQAPDGALWLGTGYRGVVRLGPPLDNLDAAPVARNGRAPTAVGENVPSQSDELAHRRSKSDQDVEDLVNRLPRGSNKETCPITALRQWLQAVVRQIAGFFGGEWL